MEKRINSLLLMLRIESCVAWGLLIIVVVIGKLGVIINGSVETGSDVEFKLNCACILSTLLILPLALQLFLLNTTKGLRRMNKDEALDFYHMWSMIRLMLVSLCIAYNIIAYFMTLNTTGILCALMGLAVTVYCLPTHKRIEEFMKIVEDDFVVKNE